MKISQNSSMVIMLVLAIPLVVDWTEAGKVIHSFAGPYIAYAERFYVCQINETWPQWNATFRHTHFNPMKPYEKQKISGYINATRPYNDTCWGYVDVATRSNNEWKEHAFIFKFPSRGCSALRSNMPSFFKALYHKKLDDAVLGKGSCAVPVGEYFIDKEPVEWVFPNVPIIPYGHYRFSIVGGAAGSTVPQVCMSVDCHAIPKP